MAMTLSEYDALIKRLEDLQARDPGSYKVRVFGLAVLGFAYVIGVFLLMLTAWGVGAVFSFMGGLIWLTLVCAGGFCFTLYSSARTLFVSLERPQGRVLHRDEAPDLFDEFESIRAEIDAPAIHEILLTGDYNAAMVQTPRLGIFGWHYNTMILGLPLLMSLSRDELRSVLGHELGHAAGQHSKFAGWIYRLRKTWEKLQQAIIAQEHPTFLFKHFLERFIPYFNAYTFVLARANEYEADRAAARVTSPEVAARALLRVHLDNAHLEASFWKGIDELNKTSPLAPTSLYSSLRDALTEPRDESASALELEKALARRTDLVDTHPSLEKRLAALGVEAAIPEPVEEVAATSCLGDRYQPILDEFSLIWKTNAQPVWAATHTQYHQQLERLEALEALVEDRAIDSDGEDEQPAEVDEAQPLSMYAKKGLDLLEDNEFLEYAEIIEIQHDKDEAMALFRARHEHDPESAGVRFGIGRILLSEEDEEGITWLKEAMAREELYTGAVCELILNFEYNVRDDKDRAQVWLDRHDAWNEKLALANQERRLIAPEDGFLPHDLPLEELDALLAILRRHHEIKAAWLVRKDVEHFPERQLFVLGIMPRRIKLPTANRQQQLIQRIVNELAFEHEIILFNLGDGNLGWLKAKLKKFTHELQL